MGNWNWKVTAGKSGSANDIRLQSLSLMSSGLSVLIHPPPLSVSANQRRLSLAASMSLLGGWLVFVSP
jgi:hypothetical protein